MFVSLMDLLPRETETRPQRVEQQQHIRGRGRICWPLYILPIIITGMILDALHCCIIYNPDP